MLESISWISSLGELKPLSNIPESIGILFTEKDQISVHTAASIILYALRYNIKRVSFYDPWNLITLYEYEITTLAAQMTTLYYLNSGLDERIVKVFFLQPKESLKILGVISNRMIAQQITIDKRNITNELNKEYIFNIDLLVKIGSIPTICGYPAWALHLAEIVSIPRFKRKNHVDEDEFVGLLKSYNSRNRRPCSADAKFKCPPNVCLSGCKCVGYFRKTSSGKCVLRKDCGGIPKKCKTNEVFMQCGKCQDYCDFPPTDYCTAHCKKPGCYCPKGFFVKSNNECVRKENCGPVPTQVPTPCPMLCQANEVYTDCGFFEKTCKKRIVDTFMGCLPPGCYCCDPFVRREDTGCCIYPNKC
uniref:TIL domain-containing protein n=1 Tax=Rhabditophanes sp. KR3021 TaxID=114890 RepID=A0AC35TTI7_9BILA